MIIKTPSGHYDTDLLCGECGERRPWQPEDRDPHVDDWWCNACGEWSEPTTSGKWARTWPRDVK